MDFSPMPEDSGKNLKKTYRFNPVEMIIFATVSVVFIKSIYSLVSEAGPFKISALRPMQSNPVLGGSLNSDVGTSVQDQKMSIPTRSVAQIRPQATGQLSVEFRCQQAEEEPVIAQASKVKLVGIICEEQHLQNHLSPITTPPGSRSPSDASASQNGEQPRIRVYHAGLKTYAEVFANTQARKFSTDYIPLSPGLNTLLVEFAFSAGTNTHPRGPASAGASTASRVYTKTISFQRSDQ